MTFLDLDRLPWLITGLLLLAGAAAFAARLRRDTIRGLAGDPAGSSLCTSARPLGRRLRGCAAACAAGLFVVAMLRPVAGLQINRDRLPPRHILLVVDVSKSMGCADADGLTRLEAGKLYGRRLIESLPVDRIGLVSFSGAAFAECPLTLDRSTLVARLDRLEPGIIPVPGTRLSEALDKAADLLGATPPAGSALVLLSDGDRLTGDVPAAIATVRDLGIPVHTVALGAPTTTTPIPNNTSFSSSPDPALLEAIASSTAGLSLRGDARGLDAAVARLRNALDSSDRAGLAGDENLRRRPVELFAYPLAAAVGLLFLRLFLNPRSRHFRPLVASLALLAGARLPVVAADPPPAADRAGYQAALADAARLDRPLLLIFTGSDWSEASIAFELEILRHPGFEHWSSWRVVPLVVDLPRAGLDRATREARRSLAERFRIDRFPTALFLDPEAERELGRLFHDQAGPARWLTLADRILAGDATASHAPSSIDQLPAAERRQLEDPALPADLRATLHYNRAIEEVQLHPLACYGSRDRFNLVRRLLERASQLAGPDRPDIRAAAFRQLACLHHLRGRFLAENMQRHELEEAARLCGEARRLHARSAAVSSVDSPNLPGDLARLSTDLGRVESLLEFQEAYRTTVETVLGALTAEDVLVRGLDLGAVAALPLNDPGLDASVAGIRDLDARAGHLEHPAAADIAAALEDILRAAAPHRSRNFPPARTAIHDALMHLLKNAAGDPGESPDSGAGDAEDGAGQSDRQGDSVDDDDRAPSPSPAKRSRQLADAGERQGDLHDRLRDRLGKKNQPPIPPAEDH